VTFLSRSGVPNCMCACFCFFCSHLSGRYDVIGSCADVGGVFVLARVEAERSSDGDSHVFNEGGRDNTCKYGHFSVF